MSDTLGDAVSHHAAALDDPNEGRPTVSCTASGSAFANQCVDSQTFATMIRNSANTF